MTENNSVSGGGATQNNYSIRLWPDGDLGACIGIAIICLSIGGCNYLSKGPRPEPPVQAEAKPK